jgi:hypothetical protein
MINTKLQSIIDTKSAIGNAIVNKGGTITSETPFFNYAAQIDGISTGTPQTIFAASDGSKWALTNVVNLTNVSNNVTHDFNYWQPANNSTSDPILNVGTVNGNISGNIKIVQVNQVNISQYENIVINDTDGAKYVGYNGYDSQTNPTPTGNTTFNRWLLNNSASGTVLFANTTIVNGGIYNGPNTIINEANMAFVNNSVTYNSAIYSVTTNNGFIYVGGGILTGVNRGVAKYHESNLVRVGNTVNYGGIIESVTTNNGFIYVGGATNQRVQKFYESNLAFVGSTATYGGTITSVTTNDGFIYAGGATNQRVQKFYESNLAFVGSTVTYGGDIHSIFVNNGFIYVGGYGDTSNGKVQAFHENNLARAFNSPVYIVGYIESVAVNNGFVYVGGYGIDFSSAPVSKYHESNLVFVGNTANYGGYILSVTTNDGFIYVGGATNNTAQKFYESNLTFVGNTNSYGTTINSITINNGFIYVGGGGDALIRKYQEKGLVLDNQTFYTATKIKE